jgi:RNA polymerase sigma-70 factor (ECF subfamily)
MNDTEADIFDSHRPFMLSIAYRMLGSRTEAEDIVQKAYLRYQSADRSDIVSHRAFFSTMITRLCLNHLQLAQNQRETYIGTWLPEPTLTAQDDALTPPEQTELHESLSMAFLLLMEQLTPLERAVFLLHEVFDYKYGEIAKIVDREEDACRQILSRAKKHVMEKRPRFTPSPEEHREMLNRFLHTVREGDFEGLLTMLSEDVTLWADGGGKRRGAVLKPVQGRDQVKRFLTTWQTRAPENPQWAILPINGAPALVISDDEQIHIVLSISVDAGHITDIHVVGNPDKLKWIKPSQDQENEP